MFDSLIPESLDNHLAGGVFDMPGVDDLRLCPGDNICDLRDCVSAP